MLEFFRHLLSSAGFEPHGHCYLWQPDILWLQVGSDGLIALAYYSIPLALFYFVRKRGDLAYRPMFMLFAAFIWLCGTTHLFEIWTVWHGTYRLEGIIKFVTGGVSIVTAALLWPIIPAALALPSPTALAQANQELQTQAMARHQAEQQFRAVVESAPDALVMVNAQGIIELVNAQTEALFGYTRQELLGQPVERLVPERFRQQHRQHRQEYGMAPRVRMMGAGYDLWGRRKDGSEFPVEISLSPLVRQDQILTLSAIRDVTDRQRMQEALQRAHDELEQRVVERTQDLERVNLHLQHEIRQRQRSAEELARSNADLEQFASVASHDLQEPLRMILGFTRLLAERLQGHVDDHAKSHMTSILEAASRMQTLIRELLAYARVAQRELVTEAVPLDETMHHTLRVLTPQIQETRAEIQCDPLPTVQGNATQLGQVFQNLVSNALKYHDEDTPRITVTVQPQEAEWLFAIQDNGIGLEPRFAERIFAIFQRLHTRTEYAGTGIGLALCKKIVERHGGRIWVESQPGAGATFYFTLPR